MWRLTLKGLLAHKARLTMTALAVVVGTGFVAGALTFGDTLEQGFDDLFTSIVGTSDAIVRPAGEEPAEGLAAGMPQQPELLDPQLVDRVVALDEVRIAEGEIEGVAVLIGDDGEPVGQFGPPTFGGNVFEHRELDPAELRAGRWPEARDEVAIDAGTAGAQGWEPGDEVAVVLDGPVETFRLVGVFGLGEMDNLAGASVVLLHPEVAAERLGTDGQVSSIYVAAADGVGEQQLVTALAQELGDEARVLTSAEFAEEQQALVAPFVELFSVVLLVFAVIALLVGGFLIFNTFTIVLASRLRELALVRAIGGSRGQLFGSVLGEAAVVGLVGGAVGAMFGLAVARGLQALLGTVGIELPGEQLVVLPRTVVVAIAIGIVVTLVASVVPARRAVRVPPVAALTEVAVAAPAGRGVVRVVVGALLLLGGVGGIAATLVGDAGPAALGAGAVAVFLGVAALSALIARPMAAAIGWLPARTGISGELARANAMRNPRRTAATASALMIGLALVSFVSIFAASLQATIERAIDRSFLLDAFVQAATQGGVPDAVVTELEGTAEVARAAPVQATALRLGEDDQAFAGVMRADDVLAVFDLDVREGSLDDITGGGLVVTQGAADRRDLGAGDLVTLGLPAGEVEVPVVAVIDGAGFDVSFILDRATFEQAGGSAQTFNVYVQFADGIGAAEGLDAVETALADYPQVIVHDQAGLAEAIGEQLNQLVAVVVALLALSVLVALLGIVNTLALSVTERVREIGLLRAVGMTRGQVRAMVRREAVVVALIGAVLGLALGIPFGAAFVAVDQFNIDTFAVPWGQLVVGVLVAAVAGLIAGVLPARRAARLDVLRALQAE